MSDAGRVAAVGVRFLSAYLLMQSALGLVGVAGLARVGSGFGAIGLVAVLMLMFLGGLLWVAAPTFGALLARGID